MDTTLMGKGVGGVAEAGGNVQYSRTLDLGLSHTPPRGRKGEWVV
jgi:hypothetical protein